MKKIQSGKPILRVITDDEDVVVESNEDEQTIKSAETINIAVNLLSATLVLDKASAYPSEKIIEDLQEEAMGSFALACVLLARSGMRVSDAIFTLAQQADDIFGNKEENE